MKSTIRLLLWVLTVCFCLRPTSAEQGILVVIAKDLADNPIPGVRIGLEGEGGSPQFTDPYGKARVGLAPQTKEGTWVKLRIVKSLANLDLVIIFPTGGFTSVPSFENETQNYVPLTLATRGDKAILEHAPGIAAIHSAINRSTAASRTKRPGAPSVPREDNTASKARSQLFRVGFTLSRPPGREDLKSDDTPYKRALADASEHFGLPQEEIEAAFKSWGGDALTWKIVDLIGLLAISGKEPFGTAVGIGTFRDILFGVAGWSLRVCTLQPVLLRFQATDAKRFDAIVGEDTSWLIDALKAPCHDSYESIASKMLDKSGILVEPWRTRLKTLAQEPIFQRVQVEHLEPLVQKAKEETGEFDLNSERAVAFFYDVIINDGLLQMRKLRDNYLEDTAAFASIVGRQPDEEERLLILVNKNAENTNWRYRENVRARRLAIALGAGYVHGREFDFDRLGIGLWNYVTGEAIQVHSDSDVLKRLKEGWLPSKQAPLSRQSEKPAHLRSQEHSVCGVALAKGIDWTDSVSGEHLAPKSFDVSLGNRGSPDYLLGRLTVTPGIQCVDGMIGFPLFGGVSKEKEYFNLSPIEGDPASAKYLEQWPKELRIFFDNGGVLKSRDFLLTGRPPMGATRIMRVEMDFDGGEKARATLTWSGQ